MRVDPERSPSDFILETPEGYTEVPYELGLSPGTVVPIARDSGLQ